MSQQHQILLVSIEPNWWRTSFGAWESLGTASISASQLSLLSWSSFNCLWQHYFWRGHLFLVVRELFVLVWFYIVHRALMRWWLRHLVGPELGVVRVSICSGGRQRENCLNPYPLPAWSHLHISTCSVFKVYPRCSVYQHFISFYRWLIFHFLDILKFVYLFIRWWRFGILLLFWLSWIMLLWTLMWRQ